MVLESFYRVFRTELNNMGLTKLSFVKTLFLIAQVKDWWNRLSVIDI